MVYFEKEEIPDEDLNEDSSYADVLDQTIRKARLNLKNVERLKVNLQHFLERCEVKRVR